MSKDSTTVVLDTIEKDYDGTYRVIGYKCGCRFYTLLDENGEETNSGYSEQCQFCFYGADGVPDLLD